MRAIEQTSRFKRDLKREAQGPHQLLLKTHFVTLLGSLANDQPLANKHHDHALAGRWKNHRECHVAPDLLLIYKKLDTGKGGCLQLTRLGSHSELFG